VEAHHTIRRFSPAPPSLFLKSGALMCREAQNLLKRLQKTLRPMKICVPPRDSALKVKINFERSKLTSRRKPSPAQAGRTPSSIAEQNAKEKPLSLNRPTLNSFYLYSL
jgi:hypothetical protein